MKKVVFWVIASLGLIIYIVVSFSDPGERLLQSFRQACKEVTAARQLESASYAAAFKLYNNAINRLNNITGKYSSSDIALKLIKNQLKIGPYQFLEFKEEVVPRAKLRAEAENNPLSCAFYAISLLDTIRYDDKLKLMKAAKLAEISTRFSQDWQFGKAASTLKEAKNVVRTIYSDLFKVNALAEMARVLGVSGKKREALKLLAQAEALAKTIEEPERSESFIKLVEVYCTVEQFWSAEGLSQLLDPAEQDTAWSIIGKKYAEKGRFRSALNLAAKIEDGSQKADTLQAIINRYAAKGHFEKAQKLVAELNPVYAGAKAKAIADIGFHAAKAGDRDLAAAQFEKAIKTADLFESYELPQKLAALNYIAFRFLELRDFQNAGRLLESNSAIAKNMPEFNRAEAFSEIAAAYGMMGQYDQALKLIQLYIPDILSIDIHNSTIARLASEYAAHHQFEPAVLLAKQTGEAATILDADQTSILSDLAIKYAGFKDYHSALQLTQEINCPFYRPWTLAEIALLLPNRHFYTDSRTKQYLHQIITDLNQFKSLN